MRKGKPNAPPPDLSGSSLPVGGLLLARETGYRPIRQVAGASIYHVGWQFPSASGEMEALTKAQRQVRLLALSRMQEQARALGAQGVIGIQVLRNRSGARSLEFSAAGMAIGIAGEAAREHPFLSCLTGAELWALKKAGFSPVGTAFGSCVWYEAASFQTLQAAGVGGSSSFGSNPSSLNQELADFTQATARARENAMARLRDECSALGASGVLRVEVEKKLTYLRTYSLGLIVSFQVFGSAVSQVEDADKRLGIDYRLLLGDPPSDEKIFLDL
ncbi:MAG TPA: heavy metal-binding domain-containing protein [Capsulimonadaceae bacterium]|nr:heavy metal-binding domain-containing protein [Capsulimonadaceae bacterium]